MSFTVRKMDFDMALSDVIQCRSNSNQVTQYVPTAIQIPTF